jgi:hypothetical protein
MIATKIKKIIKPYIIILYTILFTPAFATTPTSAPTLTSTPSPTSTTTPTSTPAPNPNPTSTPTPNYIFSFKNHFSFLKKEAVENLPP